MVLIRGDQPFLRSKVSGASRKVDGSTRFGMGSVSGGKFESLTYLLAGFREQWIIENKA